MYKKFNFCFCVFLIFSSCVLEPDEVICISTRGMDTIDHEDSTVSYNCDVNNG